MDIKELLLLKAEEFDTDSKEVAYTILSNSKVDEFPKRSLRKALEVCLEILKFKGEQVTTLQEQVEANTQGDGGGDESLDGKLLEENENLKRSITKLEAERLSLKVKVTEMADEIADLQKRLHEMNTGESDKGSSDPLSELDRQEEILKNISTKNKHIKRLLRDIEELQLQNVEQSKTIIELEGKLQVAKGEIEEITLRLTGSEKNKEELLETIERLNAEINRLESNINYLEDEREKSEDELKQFIQKLEERAYAWRCSIDEKEEQLESLRKKYEELYQRNSSGAVEYGQEAEVNRLVEVLQEKDVIIAELEEKLKNIAEEMVASTRVMNKISAERELEKNKLNSKQRSCCKEMEIALQGANSRCKELSQMLETVEEDNILKARQAFDALASLEAYQKGQDGLPQSLRKVSQLQQKLNSRDRQIKALVMEVNSLHEISQENSLLRKKLNIPEDAIISTTNLVAKQKSKDKMLERVNLKLRASEEMRLQLKIEKSELRKEIIDLQRRLEALKGKEPTDPTLPSNKNTSEAVRAEVYCDNCLRNIQTLPKPDSVVQNVIREWEAKYSNVVEENENLRVGMHEILEKIREYDASSNHITIDCTILEKVLHALDARSISGWYHPAMRMQNELIAVKEREQALRERVNLAEKVQLVEREIEEMKKIDENFVEHESLEDVEIEAPNDGQSEEQTSVNDEKDEKIQSTPLPQSEDLFPIIVEKDAETLSARTQLFTTAEKYRDLLLENEKLRVFQVQFEEMLEKLKESESEITKYCSGLIEKVTDQEIQFNIQAKKYDFLKEDFDQVLKDYKNSELKNIILLADLKKQLNDRKHELCVLKSPATRKKILYKSPNAENIDNSFLQKQFLRTQTKLALLIKKIFSKEIPDFILKLDDKQFMDCGVILENLQVNYITVEEYDKMRSDYTDLLSQFKEENTKCKHLEELQLINQEQIKSQQKLLSEVTDSHIELRHLVADLQSSSEEKFLISKAHRDLTLAKNEINKLKAENDKLEGERLKLGGKLSDIEKEMENLIKTNKEDFSNNEIKLKFLEKSLNMLREKYCKYTPLILLTNFLPFYAKSLKEIKPEEDAYSQVLKDLDNSISSKLTLSATKTQSQDLINLVKYETKCNFLENQISVYARKSEALQIELDELKLSTAEEHEHWKTIQALFDNNKTVETDTKSIQCGKECRNASTNTEDWQNVIDTINKNDELSPKKIVENVDKTPEISSPVRQSSVKSPSILSLESQLKQAMNLASMRSALLLETENRLAEAQGRIKEMEKNLEGKKQLLKQEIEKTSIAEEKAFQKSSSIVESTISSLQSLLSEKDNTLSHYQELLKTERDQHSKSCDNYEKELNRLKKTIATLESEVRSKEIENLELKSKIGTEGSRKSSKSDTELDDELDDLDRDEKHFNEMSDEKIEEMFLDESKHMTPTIFNEASHAETDDFLNKQIHQIQVQLREAKNREIFWEKSIRAKDEEISLLKEKLIHMQERDKVESSSAEIDQLKILIEEKDRHLSDLMETLTSFHDDQQRFINETSLYSADQVSQLGADLSRCENTNKILTTQIEALRRQVASLTQREKQARDLANSLKTQLIKRPVIPIKNESIGKKSSEQLQKRLSQLETELDEAKQQIKRQQNIIDAKRAKNATEINLWEKQKRWQQNAEKLKTKLEETEASLEKTKTMLSTARTTVEKLEKEKHSLESKLRGSTNKCCRTPSCPNLLAKYGSSETPDSFTGGSELNSPVRRQHLRLHLYNTEPFDVIDSTNKEIINALKARNDSQQRKIIALELEGRGSNALITEIEKLQEKVSALEAQNIRFEARNLQLQLDNDLLRQGDVGERLQKRIKHLEEYTAALKEELARAEAQKLSGGQESKSGGQPEQTILALKRIVEKLRVENKNLREGRKHPDSRNIEPRDGLATCELSRLQHVYAEALDKISALQIEVQLKSGCCSICREKSVSNLEGGGDMANELKLVKEQLMKKTQLLEKAKILLTRAAAKEKSLKEQLAIWKRKCAELQNVPVIEEISE